MWLFFVWYCLLWFTDSMVDWVRLVIGCDLSLKMNHMWWRSVLCLKIWLVQLERSHGFGLGSIIIGSNEVKLREWSTVGWKNFHSQEGEVSAGWRMSWENWLHHWKWHSNELISVKLDIYCTFVSFYQGKCQRICCLCTCVATTSTTTRDVQKETKWDKWNNLNFDWN